MFAARLNKAKAAINGDSHSVRVPIIGIRLETRAKKLYNKLVTKYIRGDKMDAEIVGKHIREYRDKKILLRNSLPKCFTYPSER